MSQISEPLRLVEKLKAELESLDEKAAPRPAPVDNLGAIVKETRKEQRLTQVELADLAGIGSATLKRIEAGNKDVTFANVLSVLDALGLDLWIG